MSTLIEVSDHFKVDRIFDTALVQGMVAVAAGEQGLVLVNPENGVRVAYATNIALDGPILVSPERIFFSTYSAQPDPQAAEIELSACEGAEALGLQRIETLHHSFATRTCLYLLRNEGDLLRFRIEAGSHEIPESPYGKYEKSDHRVLGIGRSRQGVIVLSRYEGRAEHLVDALPDDPTRPKARAAVLKDDDFGTRISGPGVAVRWTYLLSHEKCCLLSQHLRNPEVLHRTEVPADLAAQEEVFLYGDGIGRVWAASNRGLDLLVGPGAPDCFAFPDDASPEPVRLIGDERFALVLTRDGKLYQALPAG